MSRPKIIAGNWKMNNNLSEAITLVESVINNSVSNSAIKIFFPSFPFIATVANKIQSSPNFFVGAQNCSEHASGAFTGEVAASMLNSIGCAYVLVGHSERRQYFGESSPLLTKKIHAALANGLKPVFCFGETLQERKSNTHFEVVKDQINEVLNAFSATDMSQIILAYEPVWAIGTGETATPQQAQEMHAHIRTCLSKLFNENVANSTPILYGGSCNAQNAKELFACADIDGGLIGGASLKADDFCKIIASV